MGTVLKIDLSEENLKELQDKYMEQENGDINQKKLSLVEVYELYKR
jgi:hypothetical protein